MQKQVKNWVQSYYACRPSKAHRRTKVPIDTFALSYAKFEYEQCHEIISLYSNLRIEFSNHRPRHPMEIQKILETLN